MKPSLQVIVHNKLPDDLISIHWHGLMMKGEQVYDGVVGLTQCGITPGETFTYRLETSLRHFKN